MQLETVLEVPLTAAEDRSDFPNTPSPLGSL